MNLELINCNNTFGIPCRTRRLLTALRAPDKRLSNLKYATETPGIYASKSVVSR